MRRNMNLVRAILLELESRPFQRHGETIRVNGFSGAEVSYHIKLLADVGWIEAIQTALTDAPYPDWVALSITWSGHQFLDAVAGLPALEEIT